ncbi:hypothetical protein OAS86_02525 [Gammaproteobacteria bacterium]|nr:hypothetical protein [Gammaproteobacteria bacterium]
MNISRHLLTPLAAALILSACANRGDVRLNSERIADLESRVTGIASSLETDASTVITAMPAEILAPSNAPETFTADSLIADRPDRKPDFIVWFKRASDEVDYKQTASLDDFVSLIGPDDQLTLLGTNGGSHPEALNMASERVTAAASLLNGRSAQIAAARYEPDQPGRRVMVWLDQQQADDASEQAATSDTAIDETLAEAASEASENVSEAVSDVSETVKEAAVDAVEVADNGS